MSSGLETKLIHHRLSTCSKSCPMGAPKFLRLGTAALRRLFFVKLPVEQLLQFRDGGRGVMTFGMDGEAAAGTGGEHHQAHDALAVDLFAVLLDEDVAMK